MCRIKKQESPPPWMQDVYRPQHSKCSLCSYVSWMGGKGLYPHPVLRRITSIQSKWGGGYLHPVQMERGYPHPVLTERVPWGTSHRPDGLPLPLPPPPAGVNRLKIWPSVILRMQTVNNGLENERSWILTNHCTGEFWGLFRQWLVVVFDYHFSEKPWKCFTAE